jgi:hypothetical protein
MDEDQNNQHNHDGHINLDPHTSLHDLTPEQMQQIQKILRALPPVSSDLLELIELVDVGAGRHHIQSEFRGKSHQNQVPGQEPGECGEHTVHQHHLITRSSLPRFVRIQAIVLAQSTSVPPTSSHGV